VLRLRGNLKHRLQSNLQETAPSSATGQHFLDSAAFWKEQYEAMKYKCEEVERQNVQLQRANDSLQTRPNIDDYLNNNSTSSKRKVGGSKASGTSKRPKPSPTNLAPSVTSARDTLEEDVGILEGLGEGKIVRNSTILANKLLTAGGRLAHNLYVSHRLYEQQVVDPEAICFNLIEVARAIGSVTKTVAKHYEHLVLGSRSGSPWQEHDKSDVSCVIRAAARAFASLMLGLEKINNAIYGIENRSRLAKLVVCEVVKMFQKILDSISEAARLSVDARPKSPTKNGKQQKASVKDGPTRTLVLFANGLLSYLKKNEKDHKDIFEGMLFLLMDRVGKCLFECTFDQRPTLSVEGGIKLPVVDEHPDVVAAKEIRSLTVRLEARSLAAILKKALGLAPHHLNSHQAASSSTKSRRSSAMTRTSTTNAVTQASSAPLSTYARDKLQRTLLRCMFGEKDNDEFADILCMPAQLGPMPTFANVKDEDVPEWFQGEVWRLVGWDLLGREGSVQL
jgi:hypothetical protein